MKYFQEQYPVYNSKGYHIMIIDNDTEEVICMEHTKSYILARSDDKETKVSMGSIHDIYLHRAILGIQRAINEYLMLNMKCNKE